MGGGDEELLRERRRFLTADEFDMVGRLLVVELAEEEFLPGVFKPTAFSDGVVTRVDPFDTDEAETMLDFEGVLVEVTLTLATFVLVDDTEVELLAS